MSYTSVGGSVAEWLGCQTYNLGSSFAVEYPATSFTCVSFFFKEQGILQSTLLLFISMLMKWQGILKFNL